MTPEQLRQHYERQVRVLGRRPELAAVSPQARARSGGDALVCEVEHGDGRGQRVDLPVDEGGTGGAPHPGQLLRASVAACLALGYRVWAARLSVPLESAEVEITCELDVRGQLGVADDVAVGWQRMLIESRLRGRASAEELRRVAETAAGLSPILACLSPAIERVHRLHLVDTRRGTDRSTGGHASQSEARAAASGASQQTSTEDEDPKGP